MISPREQIHQPIGNSRQVPTQVGSVAFWFLAHSINVDGILTLTIFFKKSDFSLQSKNNVDTASKAKFVKMETT